MPRHYTDRHRPLITDAANSVAEELGLSFSAERFDPSLARELTRQADDTLAAAVSKYPDRFLGFATLPMLDPRRHS
jgi:predicted TIM-barrel fold metal-dependent hydrolase